MTDFLYIYRCAKCGKYLSIPLMNIDLESDNRGIYEQFFEIINNVDKECTFCMNNIQFSPVEFPVKHLDYGNRFIKEKNELFNLM